MVYRIFLQAKPTNNAKKEGSCDQRLLAGKRDKKDIAEDIGVRVHTLYNVTRDLRAHCYTGIGTSARAKSNTPLSFSHSSAPLVNKLRTSREDDTRGFISSDEIEKGEKYFTRDISLGNPASRGRSRRTSGGRPRERGLSLKE